SAPCARRRLCGARAGGAFRLDHRRRRAGRGAAGAATPACTGWQNDSAAEGRRGAAAGAARAHRAGIPRVGARSGALRADGGGQGMTGMRRSLVALAAAVLAACAARGPLPPAPVVDRSPSPRAAPQAPVAAPGPATAPAPDGFYWVKRGDTLYSIALEHGADYRELAQWNDLGDPTRIRAGQLLRVRPDETKVQVGRAPVASRIESRPLDMGSPPTPAPPPPAASAPKAAPAPSPPPPAAPKETREEFIWPAKGKILAGFAEPRSKGIDIDGKLGDPVVAAAAGRVTYIGSGIPGLGKLVVIKHDNGF